MVLNIDEFNKKFYDKYKPNLNPPYIESISNLEDNLSRNLQSIKELDFWGSISDGTCESVYYQDHVHPWMDYTILNYQFGEEWKEWEPETIYQTIEEDLGFKPDDNRKNVAMMLKTLEKTDKFWNDYRVLGWTSQAWNGEVPSFKVLPKPYPAYLLEAISSISLLYTDIFDLEAKLYIREICRFHGTGAPLSLKFAERPTSDLVKEYLNTTDESAVEEVLNEAKERNKKYSLKTIGMIDYYMYRLTMLKEQLTELFGGLK